MKAKTRVVHVSSVHRADDPRIFEKECQSLHQAGYDVRLVATGLAPTADFPVYALNRPSSRVLRGSWGATKAMGKALAQKPDLVHIHDPELIVWIPLLRSIRIKVIFDAHEDITEVHQKEYAQGIRGRILQHAGRNLLRIARSFATAIVAATPVIQRPFANCQTALVQNFPVITPVPATPMKQPGSPFSLVYVGWLTEARGARELVELLATVGPAHNVRLSLAGWIPDPLEEELRNHAGWQYVDFKGSLDRLDVDQLLASSDLGVVLFLPSPNHFESQPTKMFEYMAASIPVLASDYPLWRRVVQDAGVGLVCNPESPHELVSIIKWFVENREVGRRMGESGREVAKRERSWSVESQKLCALYADLLGGPNALT